MVPPKSTPRSPQFVNIQGLCNSKGIEGRTNKQLVSWIRRNFRYENDDGVVITEYSTLRNAGGGSYVMKKSEFEKSYTSWTKRQEIILQKRQERALKLVEANRLRRNREKAQTDD